MLTYFSKAVHAQERKTLTSLTDIKDKAEQSRISSSSLLVEEEC